MTPKIFVVIPARNDAWILPKVLGAASLWADHIIVADENSWDNTEEVCRQFPKVQLLRFEPKEFNESHRRQVLLEAVREHGGQNLVFGLDSDEILSAEVLNQSVLREFVSQMRPGMSAKLQWIMLWKNTKQYRYDAAAEWSANFKHFAYWDDGKMNFDNVRMHSPRVPESAMDNFVTFRGFRVLHYAFAEWQRTLAKHIYYLALEKTMGSTRHPYRLDRRYHWFYKEGRAGLVIKLSPGQWYEGYERQGLELHRLPEQKFYWYDAEVLRFFKRYGLKPFRHLNIWRVDWEQKRQLAVAAGEGGLPGQPIQNPQPWYDALYYRLAEKLYRFF